MAPAHRIGVLLCDHVDPDLRPVSGGDYGEVFDRLLRAADPEVVTIAYDAVGGRLPDTPTECDAWLLSGSRHDAHGDDPWIVDLMSWVRGAVSGGARVGGICFGHQLVARALGGVVEPAAQWAVGPHRLRLDPTEWFRGGEVYLEAMHRDVVVSLPPGARSLGAGSTARHPAFGVGDNVLCVQDHPEFTESYVAALIDRRRERIGPEVSDAAIEALASCPNDGPEVAAWIVDFLLDRRNG